MQKYIAFISGLPAGTKAITADKLQIAMTRLGFHDVRVPSNSGTISFEAHPVGIIGPLEAQISRHLKNAFELDHVWTFIRTPQELRRIIDGVPFSEEEREGNSIFVVLLAETPDKVTAQRLEVRRTNVDELRVAGREIYWLRRHKAEHVAPPPISELLDSPATVRSAHALQQILSELDQPKSKPKTISLDDAIRSERSRQ